MLLNVKCVCLSFSINVSEKFFIITRIERDMIEMCIGFDVKYLLLLSDFNESWYFTADFWKVIKY
jgi:hypothetical protein